MTKIIKRVTLPTGEKAKIILDVYWVMIGKQSPYLSSHNYKVIINNSIVSEAQEKTAIECAPDIKFLLSCHLKNQGSGQGMHQVANTYYYIQQYRSYLAQGTVPTKEDIQAEIDSCVQQLSIIWLRACTPSRFAAGGKPIKDLSILRKFKTFDKTGVLDVIKQNKYSCFRTLVRLYLEPKTTIVYKWVCDYLTNITDIEKSFKHLSVLLEKQRNSKSQSDTMTLEKLHSLMPWDDINTTKQAVFVSNKQDLADLLEPYLLNDMQELAALSEQYSIETKVN